MGGGHGSAQQPGGNPQEKEAEVRTWQPTPGFWLDVLICALAYPLSPTGFPLRALPQYIIPLPKNSRLRLDSQGVCLHRMNA